MTPATSGLLYHLSSVPWDWFGTLTFGMRKVPLDQSQPDLLEQGKKFKIMGCRVPPVAVRYSMFYQWLRQQEHYWKQKKTQWVLRQEKGELGGRPHFHFLIRALPSGANTSHFRMAAMSRWESLGGGMTRIRPFDNQAFEGEKDAVCYVLKNLGGNAYELAKFEHDEFDSIRISDALIASLSEQSQEITVLADLEDRPGCSFKVAPHRSAAGLLEGFLCPEIIHIRNNKRTFRIASTSMRQTICR